ncbi:MAG: CBS domain-containing protein [Candidatus Hodarchaeales archaeon]|jgi:predicted transcriptional regulator
MLVSDYMKKEVKTVTKDLTIQEAAKIMVENKIGSCVVVDEKNFPIGVITRTDVLNYFVMSGDKIDPKIPLVNFLKDNLITIKPSDQISSAKKLMSESQIHHLVVVDNTGKVSGILSTMDILTALQHE